MTLRQAIVQQFRKPVGLLGTLAGWIMAHRPSNKARNLWTLELLALQPTERVLEIGCGPGFTLAAAAQRLPRGRILGVDHSATMLRQAEARTRPAVESKRVELRCGDFETAIAPMEAFDKIYSVNVFQFLDDKEAALKLLYGALVPGGLLATTYMPRGCKAHRSDTLVMSETLEKAMRDVGFTDLHTEELDLKPMPAICVLGRRPEG